MNQPLILRAADIAAERPAGSDDDIHFTEALAESVILHTTEPGGVVLDPFAGYGTTLVVADRLGRRAIGVELLPEHVAIARTRTAGRVPVIQGDARRLAELVTEPVDLLLTSPPYMADRDHPQNPLTGYQTDDAVYETYLRELGQVFAQARPLLQRSGRVVINVADPVAPDGRVTPLATDLAEEVARHLTLLGATRLRWDEHPPGLAADYLLWFAA